MRRAMSPSIVVLMAVAALAPSTAGAAGAAAAKSGSAAVSVTAGSNYYREFSARASFDLPRDFYLSPSASFYRSDDADGTYKLFGLRGGYEPGPWSFGADLKLQPPTDGYSKSALGGVAAYAFPVADAAFFDLG